MKRKGWLIITLCLALCLATVCAGGAALAEQPVEITVTETEAAEGRLRVSAEDAEREYLNSVFGLPVTPVQDLQLYGLRATVAGDQFEKGSRERILYDALKSRVKQVAEGEIFSTQFTFTGEEFAEMEFTAESLELDSNETVFEGNGVSAAAKEKINAILYPMLDSVTDAVMYDCPYEVFWRDLGYSRGWGASGSYYYDENNELVEILYVNRVTINIFVSVDYRGANELTTNATKIGKIQTAGANARAIVAANAGLSNYDKLAAYKDAICELTEYNHPAVDEDWDYGDPWQLVQVFDGDPSTTVVCEGYSKAFQYLCDRSTWNGRVETISVSGNMWTLKDGSWESGNHMWNLVRMNGLNYLADITNTDSGNAGLFLDGYDRKEDDIYFYDTGYGSIGYSYGKETLNLFGDSGRLDPATTVAEDVWIPAAAPQAEDGFTLSCAGADDQGVVRMLLNESADFEIDIGQETEGLSPEVIFVCGNAEEGTWIGEEGTGDCHWTAHEAGQFLAYAKMRTGEGENWVCSNPVQVMVALDPDAKQTEEPVWRVTGDYDTAGGRYLVPQDGVLTIEVTNTAAEFYGAYVTTATGTDWIADTHWVEKEWAPGVTLLHLPVIHCEADTDYEVHVYTVRYGAEELEAEETIPILVTEAEGDEDILVCMEDSYIVSSAICFYARYTGTAELPESAVMRITIREENGNQPEGDDPNDAFYDEIRDPQDFWETNARIGKRGNYMLEASILWFNPAVGGQEVFGTPVVRHFRMETDPADSNLDSPVITRLPGTIFNTQAERFSFDFTTDYPQHISVFILKDESDGDPIYFAEASFWYEEDMTPPTQHFNGSWGMPGLSFTEGAEGGSGTLTCTPGFTQGLENGGYTVIVMADRWNYETSETFGHFTVTDPAYPEFAVQDGDETVTVNGDILQGQYYYKIYVTVPEGTTTFEAGTGRAEGNVPDQAWLQSVSGLEHENGRDYLLMLPPEDPNENETTLFGRVEGGEWTKVTLRYNRDNTEDCTQGRTLTYPGDFTEQAAGTGFTMRAAGEPLYFPHDYDDYDNLYTPFVLRLMQATTLHWDAEGGADAYILHWDSATEHLNDFVCTGTEYTISDQTEGGLGGNLGTPGVYTAQVTVLKNGKAYDYAPVRITANPLYSGMPAPTFTCDSLSVPLNGVLVMHVAPLANMDYFMAYMYDANWNEVCRTEPTAAEQGQNTTLYMPVDKGEAGRSYYVQVEAVRFGAYAVPSEDAVTITVENPAPGLTIAYPLGETGRTEQNPAGMCSEYRAEVYAPGAGNIFFYINGEIAQADPGENAEYSGLLTEAETVITAEAVYADGSKQEYGPVTLYAAGSELGNLFTEPDIPLSLTAGKAWSFTLERPDVGSAAVRYDAWLEDITNGRDLVEMSGMSWRRPLDADTILSVAGDRLIAGNSYELKLRIYAEGYQPEYITKKLTATATEKEEHDPIILNARIEHFDGTPDEILTSPANLPLHQPVLFSFEAEGASVVRFWSGEHFEYMYPEDADQGVYTVDWDYWWTGNVRLYAQACYEDLDEDDGRRYEPDRLQWEPVTPGEIFDINLYSTGTAAPAEVTIDGLTNGTVKQGDWLTVHLSGEDNSSYSITAASIYRFDEERVRMNMEYYPGEDEYRCQIPTVMLEPGYYHIVVFAEALGKLDYSVHRSFVVTENSQLPEGFAVTTNVAAVNGVYQADVMQDIQVCYRAPDRDGYRKYYRFYDGRNWDWDMWDMEYGEKTLQLEAGEWTLKAELHYVPEDENEEEIIQTVDLPFVVSSVDGIQLDIDWAYDLGSHAVSADGDRTLFAITTPEGKSVRWYDISVSRIGQDGEEDETLAEYHSWAGDPLPAGKQFSVKENDTNLRPGDLVRVWIDMGVQGCNGFHAEGTMTFVNGTDNQLRLLINGEDEEIDTPTRTYVTVEIQVSGEEDERPTELFYWRAASGDWCRVWNYQKGDDRARFTEQFDSGDWPMVVYGLYETEGGEPAWNGSVSNRVVLHVTAGKQAAEAVYNVDKTTVTRGELMTVNITGPKNPEGAEEPTFFSINFRNDNREDERGTFIEGKIPLTVRIPTSRLHAGTWYVCADSSAADCEWTVSENGRQEIQVNEPAQGSVVLDLPEVIHTDEEFCVSGYAAGAEQIIVHYLRGETDTPDTYEGDCVYEERQRLESGDYTIWAEAFYSDGTSAESEPETREVDYAGQLEIELNVPEGGIFEAGDGLTFTVEGLEQEYSSGWRTEVRNEQGRRLAEWRETDNVPDTTEGVKTFTVTEGIRAGEYYFITAEVYGGAGYNGDRQETAALAITTTNGVALSLNDETEECDIIRPHSVRAAVTIPESINATYVMLIREHGNREIMKVNAHQAETEFTPGEPGSWICWAKYTTQTPEGVDDNNLWQYNGWDSVDWTGGSNPVKLTVSAPYGMLSLDDDEYTIISGTEVTRGEAFVVRINGLKTLEDPNEREWYIGSMMSENDGEGSWGGPDCHWDEGKMTLVVPTAEYDAGNYRLRIYVDAVGYQGCEVLVPVTVTNPGEGQIAATVNGITDTAQPIDIVTQEEISWSAYAPGAVKITASMNRGANDAEPITNEFNGEYGRGSLWTWGTTGTGYVTITAEYEDGSRVSKEWTVNVSAPYGYLVRPKVQSEVWYYGNEAELVICPDSLADGYNVQVWVDGADDPAYTGSSDDSGTPLVIRLDSSQTENAEWIDVDVYEWGKGFVANGRHIRIRAVDDGKVLRLPADLQAIEAGAFDGTAAEAIVIPDGLQTIHEDAFSGGLQAVITGDGISSTDGWNFRDYSFTMYGYEDSAAETFADDHQIDFVYLP